MVSKFSELQKNKEEVKLRPFNIRPFNIQISKKNFIIEYEHVNDRIFYVNTVNKDHPLKTYDQIIYASLFDTKKQAKDYILKHLIMATVIKEANRLSPKIWNPDTRQLEPDPLCVEKEGQND